MKNKIKSKVLSPFLYFFKNESSSGIILVICAILAIIIANSNFVAVYENILHTHVTIGYGDFSLSMSVLHVINDGLMAIFFLVVGMEIKREVVFDLFIGKQVGIFGVSYILVKLKIAKFPANVTKRHLYGAIAFGGIGFTMSIFVSSLSFTDEATLSMAKMSIMIASVLAATYGTIIFKFIKFKSESIV